MLSTEQRLDAIQRLGRALGDPTRCRLLLALLDGPSYPGRLADQLGLTRQNVSNHLACLRDCGVVATEPQGRQISYRLVDARLVHALEDLLSVVWGESVPHPAPRHLNGPESLDPGAPENAGGVEGAASASGVGDGGNARAVEDRQLPVRTTVSDAAP